MSTVPRTTRGTRILILAAIAFGVLFVAFKVGYTHVPPERLAAAELVQLAGAARVRISEVFADAGTLEGATGLLPPASPDTPNSKGPFVWTLDADGTLTGRSARYGVSVELATPDQGMTWTCRVTPPEHAPGAGFCAAPR